MPFVKFVKTGLFLMVLLSLSSGFLFAEDKDSEARLLFHSNHYPLLNNETQTGFLDRLTQEVLKRNGFTVEINFLPTERAFINLNQNLADGNVAKIAGLTSLYPNVRQVPGAMIEMEFSAFTLQPKPDVKNWQDLYRYRVGIVTGMKIVETNLKDHPNLIGVTLPLQLFQLLTADRVDYVVFTYWNGLSYAHRLGLQDRIEIATPALTVQDMFLYVNHTREELVPKFADTLAEIKADGTYQRLFEELLLPLQKEFEH
jgi:polar amino acid transport system substrate-binding protein